VKLFPGLDATLIQADIPYKDKEYLTIGIFSAIFWFLLIFYLTLFLVFVTGNLSTWVVIIDLFLSASVSLLSFFYIVLYPRIIIVRKIKDIDRNLIFALRHLLIQIKSGVPLFEGLVSVAKSNYGLVSEEFEKCTKSIATGTKEVEALEELAFKNPSGYFRRTIWQLTNSIRSGADIGTSLGNLVDNLSNEQRIQVRRYGSQLSPLALMYMMFAVIIPTLGITFLIIFSTFSGITISEVIFYVILIVIVIFQFMFIGIIKNRRPAIIV
jgi:flagellar protein FlaJ